MTPHKCPVCNGSGKLQVWNSTGGTATNCSYEPCNACNGTGIVWSQDYSNPYPYIPTPPYTPYYPPTPYIPSFPMTVPENLPDGNLSAKMKILLNADKIIKLIKAVNSRYMSDDYRAVVNKLIDLIIPHDKDEE